MSAAEVQSLSSGSAARPRRKPPLPGGAWHVRGGDRLSGGEEGFAPLLSNPIEILGFFPLSDS